MEYPYSYILPYDIYPEDIYVRLGKVYGPSFVVVWDNHAKLPRVFNQIWCKSVYIIQNRI